MKKLLLLILLVLSTLMVVAEEPTYDVDPGLTPDSPFYFLDQWFESESDDPDELLAHRQEKIAEALAMAREGNSKHAKEAMDLARRYGAVLENEIPPELEEEARRYRDEIEDVFEYIGEEIPELKEEALNSIIQENKIILAAKVSSKIHALCDTLSKLDPLQYAQVCKTDDDSPEWRKEQDQKLTKDQKEHAKQFAKTLISCVESPENCDCKALGVPKLEAVCVQESAKAAKCNADPSTCPKGDDNFNPGDYLPDYLIPVFMDVMGDFDHEEGDQGFGKKMPPGCEELSEKECMKVMWDKDAPQECTDAGLTGDSREDWKECDKIRERLDEQREEEREAMGEGGFAYDGPDCNSLGGEEQLRCFEDFFQYAQGKYQEHRPDNFKQCPPPSKYEEEKLACKGKDMHAEFTREGECGVVRCVPKEDYDFDYDEEEPFDEPQEESMEKEEETEEQLPIEEPEEETEEETDGTLVGQPIETPPGEEVMEKPEEETKSTPEEDTTQEPAVPETSKPETIPEESTPEEDTSSDVVEG